MLSRVILICLLLYGVQSASIGQKKGRQNKPLLLGAYQLEGLLKHVDDGKVMPASSMLLSDDGQNFDLTIVWQVGDYSIRDQLFRLTGTLIAEDQGLYKIRFKGLYDQDGLKHSKSKPPFPVMAWLEIDMDQSTGIGKSKTSFYNGKGEEMTWEFLSVQRL